MSIDITLTDNLRPIPVVRPARRSATPKVTLVCKGEKAWISVSARLREQMGLDPKKSSAVIVLASRAQIAIDPRPDATDPAVRTISTGGRINVPELVDVLNLKDGERFEIPVGMENGVLVGPMPETLFTRRAYMERKNRVNGRAA